MSSAASLALLRVGAALCVLDETLAVVSEVVATGFVAIAGCDVAVASGSSGLGLGGQRVRWGAIARLRSECHRLQGAG